MGLQEVNKGLWKNPFYRRDGPNVSLKNCYGEDVGSRGIVCREIKKKIATVGESYTNLAKERIIAKKKLAGLLAYLLN